MFGKTAAVQVFSENEKQSHCARIVWLVKWSITVFVSAQPKNAGTSNSVKTWIGFQNVQKVVQPMSCLGDFHILVSAPVKSLNLVFSSPTSSKFHSSRAGSTIFKAIEKFESMSHSKVESRFQWASQNIQMGYMTFS